MKRRNKIVEKGVGDFGRGYAYMCKIRKMSECEDL